MENNYENTRLHIVLDNIRSVFNVGSVFRTADAVGGCFIHLCGMTSDIDNPKVHKTALGAENTVPSKHYTHTMDCINELKAIQIPIYGIELTPKSKHFQNIAYPNPVALVFGHERNGVNQNIIEMCDELIMIPMAGIKESLNVSTTAGILMYEAIRDKQ